MIVEETLERDGMLECPHGCGHMINDLWDYDWGSSEEMLVECEKCEKSLTIHRRISVTYSATPDEVSP